MQYRFPKIFLLGPVQRIDDNRVPNELLKTKAEGERGVERRKAEWLDAAMIQNAFKIQLKKKKKKQKM